MIVSFKLRSIDNCLGGLLEMEKGARKSKIMLLILEQYGHPFFFKRANKWKLT